MIDKKEPSFVFVMEQHSWKQSVCNKIRVHCFPHWSSVSTTIPHLEVKDCLFSLSVRIINLFPCYLRLLHLRIFEYPRIVSYPIWGCWQSGVSAVWGETRSCRLSSRDAIGNRWWSCLSAADLDSTHLHHLTLLCVSSHSLHLCFIPLWLPQPTLNSFIRYLTWATGSALVRCVLSLHPSTLCALRLCCSASPVDPVDPRFKVN